MRSLVSSTCILLVILLILAEAIRSLNEQRYNRADFPHNFIFGSGTSAYQVEGAAAEDGRTPSVWDTSAHSGGSNENGDIACDQYHKYKEDVQLMVDTGLEAYRFSISWSRLIPNGRGHINPIGLQYYNNLINELISNGIQPHVTLFQYDLPQKLEDEYGGWLNRKIVDDFKAYANVCFREFGDRVAHWTTLNEVNVFALGAYDIGIFPPNRCSSPFGWLHCTEGDSTTEPYIVAHNLLLAHASASTLYKKKYQAKQHGYIGLNIFTYFFVPLTNTTEDVEATQRANDVYIGWFIDPLMFGDYPSIMKKNAGSRLPSFTPHESKQVKGSYDFIGVNYYQTGYIKDNHEILKTDFRDAVGDMAAKIIFKSNGIELGEFPVDSWGLQGTLEYFKQHYGNPPVFIQENGQVTSQTSCINDISRVEYLDAYVGSLLDAVRNGSDTRGYFTWSFLDLFELLDGYGSRYGLYYVNFSDPNLKRTPKLSAHWYSNFLKGGSSNDYWILEAQKNISFSSESFRSVE